MKSTSFKTYLGMLSVLAFSALSQVSCGGDSESANIDFDPEKNPIAISADLTIGSGDNEKTIVGPWYLFRYSLKNKSTSATLYLVTFKITVRGVKDGVQTEEFVFSTDPGADCEDGYSRPYTAVVVPGGTFSGFGPDASGNPFSRCIDESTFTLPPILTPPNFEGWYISGLPESDSLIYTAQIEGEGWFEVNGVITERAYISGFQVTR